MAAVPVPQVSKHIVAVTVPLPVVQTLHHTCAHSAFPHTRICSRVAQNLSHQFSSECLCLDKTTIFTSSTLCLTRSRYCSHTLPTSSAHSTRTPIQTSLLFPSQGDDHWDDDPRHGATFGRLAESNTREGYEPNDLIVMNNTEVTLVFLHRPSVTSTYDSAESIATLPHKSDL